MLANLWNFWLILAVCWQKFSYAVRGKPAISHKLKAKNRAKTTQFGHVLQANLQHNQATFVKIIYHNTNPRNLARLFIYRKANLRHNKTHFAKFALVKIRKINTNLPNLQKQKTQWILRHQLQISPKLRDKGYFRAKINSLKISSAFKISRP